MRSMTTEDPNLHFEPGSFRDPSGRVFYYAGKVYRTLANSADADAEDSPLRRALADAPAGFWNARIIPADVSITSHPVFAQVAAQSTSRTFVVEQPLLPLISYPSEWSFEMLRDAALLTLQIESDLL